MALGLIAIDRATQERHSKVSLTFLGSYYSTTVSSAAEQRKVPITP